MASLSDQSGRKRIGVENMLRSGYLNLIVCALHNKVLVLMILNSKINSHSNTRDVKHVYKKSRIRVTKHLSTDADSSTDAIGGDRL